VGQQIGTLDQAGLLTQYGYDVAGALTNVIKPQVPGSSLPPTWSYQYDQYGRLAVTTDPNGHCTTNFYDAFGDQIAQALPMGPVNIASTNNAKGLLWKQFDFLGQMTEHRYDNFGRETNKYYFATGATSPSYAVSYAYNQLDQLTNVTQFYGTNASSGYVALAYNELNSPRLPMTARLIASVNHHPSFYAGTTALLMACMAIVVVPREKRRFLVLVVGDEVARLKSVMRRPYSNNGRLRMPSSFWRFVSPIALLAVIFSEPGYYQFCTAQAQCDIPNNFSTPTVRTTNFTYDVEGNLTQVNSPEGVINYSYDLATGRLLDTCTKNSEEQFNYDALGRLHSVTVAKRNGVAVTGETTIYKYDSVGNRYELDLPNGVVTTYKYDDLNRLTNMVHQFGTTNLATYGYMLNATGRRTNALEVLRQENNSYQTNALIWQFDAMYRLTNEMNVTIYSGGTYA
jgi:YD repeat-containing protein